MFMAFNVFFIITISFIYKYENRVVLVYNFSNSITQIKVNQREFKVQMMTC